MLYTAPIGWVESFLLGFLLIVALCFRVLAPRDNQLVIFGASLESSGETHFSLSRAKRAEGERRRTRHLLVEPEALSRGV